jgi:acetyl esterase/lipase
MRPQNRFLLTTLAGAAATANALRPVKRRGPLSVPAFFWGLPTSELPLQTLALQASLALVAGRGGGRTGLRGAAGVALTAASAVGLNRLHQEALRSGEVLEQALRDELGSDYRHRIREPFDPAPDAPVSRRDILLPDFTVRRRYRVEKDIAYGEYGRRNRLDIWRRQDLEHDARAPVLVQIHGGAWMMGQKEGQGEPLMAHLVQRGWVCVAPNYRLSPRSTWPDHIVDVKKVLAWVKENIAEHGGDPEFVVITGGSAGGHLCSLAALTPNDPQFQPGFEDADTSVAACVAFYGVYDFTNRHGTGREDMQPFLEKRVFKSLVADDRPRWEQASTISHVGSDAPPFFVLHGTNDSLVPVEQARTFVDELRKSSSSPVVYAELPLAQHAFDILPSVRAAFTARAVERFLAVVRTQHGGPTPAEAVGATSSG